MSDLVGNPEDRFSRVTAQLILHSCGSMKHFKLDDLVLRVYQVNTGAGVVLSYILFCGIVFLVIN